MHLQAAILFAQEIGKFFALTALDLLNWITPRWHNIKILNQRWISKRCSSYVYPLKNPQISWNCSFKWQDFNEKPCSKAYMKEKVYCWSLLLSVRLFSKKKPQNEDHISRSNPSPSLGSRVHWFFKVDSASGIFLLG